jgi:hypothetical protein
LLKVWSAILVVFAVALAAWLGALAVAIRSLDPPATA